MAVQSGDVATFEISVVNNNESEILKINILYIS